MKWKCSSLSRVWLCCTHMNGSPPGSSVHGILQARKLEWVAILFSGELPNLVIKLGPLTAGWLFTIWATREAHKIQYTIYVYITYVTLNHCLHTFMMTLIVVAQSLWPAVCDPRGVAPQAPLSCTISRTLLKFRCIDSVTLSTYLIYLPTSSNASPFFCSFSLSQHQGLFQSVVSSHQVATVLEFQR